MCKLCKTTPLDFFNVHYPSTHRNSEKTYVDPYPFSLKMKKREKIISLRRRLLKGNLWKVETE